jgi:hypothetical protein
VCDDGGRYTEETIHDGESAVDDSMCCSRLAFEELARQEAHGGRRLWFAERIARECTIYVDANSDEELGLLDLVHADENAGCGLRPAWVSVAMVG